MLASARVLFQPTTPCLSILGRELRFGFNAEECFTEGSDMQGSTRGFGFRSQLSAECPEGSNSACVDFDNRSSRSSTLVDLQDV